MRQDLLIHIQTLYDDIGLKQAQADLKGVQAATDQTTAALSRSETTYLATAKAAQQSAIVDTILARAKQELAAITAQQIAGTITEAEAQQLLLTLRQSTIAALTQYMSAATAEVNLLSILTLSSRDLAAAQAQVASSTETATAAMEKQWKLTAQERLFLPGSMGLFRLYGPTLGIVGLTMLIAGLKGAAEAAEKEEKALISLSATLRNITPNYEQVTEAAHNLTLNLTYQSLFTHEELLDGFQRLVALGVPLTQVYDMLTTAADLATARNIGLENAVEALGRAYAGQTMRLSRLGIVMWDSAGRVKSFEQVQKELNEQFGGAAAAQMDSYIGRMHQYGAAISEVKEELGKYIEGIKGNLALFGLELISPLTPEVQDDLAVAKARLAEYQKTLTEIQQTGKMPTPGYGWVAIPDEKTLKAVEASYQKLIAQEEEHVAQLEKENEVQNAVYAGNVNLNKAREETIAKIAEINEYLEKSHAIESVFAGVSTSEKTNELLERRRDLEKQLADIDRKIAEGIVDNSKKSQQAIAQQFEDYQDLISLYNSLLEQTSKAGDYKSWQLYKDSATDAIDAIIKELEDLQKTQEAEGGMDLYVRNMIQKIKEARQAIIEATFYGPQIELLGAKVDYAKTIGDIELLNSARQELLETYDQELDDINKIIEAGNATTSTWENFYKISTQQAAVMSDIREDALAISQYKLEQVEFGFQYGTAGTEEYLSAIDQHIENIRQQQEGLNANSQEYLELQSQINSLLSTRAETVRSIAEAEENYTVALAKYNAEVTGNQQELLNFYQQYRAEQEALLSELISGTEQWWAQKQKILSIDQEILRLTQEIAKEENKAAEISYYKTAASNAMEYYQGKSQASWEKARQDYLNALAQEEKLLQSRLAQTPKGTKEQWQILSEISNLDYERLRTLEKQFEMEKGITNELKAQSGLFNLPEFVRYGLPMALAPNIGGIRGSGGGMSTIQQQNTVNIYGGYQMTAQEIASAVSKEINNFNQMAGNAIWYGAH